MTMRTIITTAMMGLALTLGACDKAEPAKADKQAKADPGAKPADADKLANADKPDDAVDAPALDPKVEKAVNVANMIANDPAAADKILDEAGLDRDSFEAMLYEIARDPDLSKSYAIAREV
ncbi:hypothetical protein DB30_04779 [Enhygromyxa salina]|uniref:Uncharacterized protein n=1 Tax=Enhygromyxa salina TaxID=215803 RepID=A0A0C1ZF90_9BACT|nr:hypothetical protein [Enhygromyxa salina]KIG16319.1 hypothetical protein DB30_04779 [Enhygromyxa salina]